MEKGVIMEPTTNASILNFNRLIEIFKTEGAAINNTFIVYPFYDNQIMEFEKIKPGYAILRILNAPSQYLNNKYFGPEIIIEWEID